MDYRLELSKTEFTVFNAAKENDLTQLKGCLHGRSRAEISILLTCKTGGATPLVIACRYGHYDIVEYLITKCNSDVEQVGSVTFDGETIEDAPPLWCASAAGHLNIVKLLVERGANVNNTTKTNSTPLRAACYDGHFPIVKYLVKMGADFEIANRHGHTCLMIACYKGNYEIAEYLIRLKADVNRRSVKGNTALHDCAESGSLEILQLLLAKGATMDVDSYGVTPLIAASVTGHLAIVEHLIDLPVIKREDRIAALELLGATFVDKKRDMVHAISLWKYAMEDRYNHKPVLPKAVNQPISAYGFAREVETSQELDDLLMDPDAMRMQALMIRERILGLAHPDTSYYIRFRGAHYADAGRFDRCIELWTYAVTMQQNILEPLSLMTQSSFLSFAELFSFMIGEAGRAMSRGRVVPPIDPKDMLMIFNKSVKELELGQKMFQTLPESEKDSSLLSRGLLSSLHLACLLARLVVDDDCCPDTKKLILAALYKLNNLKIVIKSGRTALHLACFREQALLGRYPPCQFPSPHLTKALLMVGADPNARDEDGNTPLHLSASFSWVHLCSQEIAKILIENGAHLVSFYYLFVQFFGI